MTAGLQVMHGQQAMQLLYQTYDSPTRECWKIKYLFVDRPDGYEWFKKNEQPNLLHTQRQ